MGKVSEGWSWKIPKVVVGVKSINAQVMTLLLDRRDQVWITEEAVEHKNTWH